jgi:hypothetical protein
LPRFAQPLCEEAAKGNLFVVAFRFSRKGIRDASAAIDGRCQVPASGWLRCQNKDGGTVSRLTPLVLGG